MASQGADMAEEDEEIFVPSDEDYKRSDAYLMRKHADGESFHNHEKYGDDSNAALPDDHPDKVN